MLMSFIIPVIVFLIVNIILWWYNIKETIQLRKISRNTMEKSNATKKEVKENISSSLQDLLYHFSYGFINHVTATVTVEDPVFTGDMALKYIKEWMKENIDEYLDDSLRAISEDRLEQL
jgi:hypothetical protein